MGYDTTYSLYVKSPDNFPPISTEQLEHIADCLDKLNVFDEIYRDNNKVCAFINYGCWSTYDNDMETVSRKFPQAIFELYGDGEDRNDFWRNYYFRGAGQYGIGELVYYPDLDFDALLQEAGFTQEDIDPPALRPAGDIANLFSITNGGDGGG